MMNDQHRYDDDDDVVLLVHCVKKTTPDSDRSQSIDDSMTEWRNVRKKKDERIAQLSSYVIALLDH